MLKKCFFAGMIALLVVSAVSAQQNRQLTLFTGSTSVHLSTQFRGALTSLGVSVNDVFPGRLIRGRASFPIIDGTINANDLRGEIVHAGGLVLQANNTSVRLRSFIIDISSGGIVLTGQVSVNGNTVGRIPLFDLTPQANTRSSFVQRVSLSNVAVTLRPEAADALNTVFGVTVFTAGFPIGTAAVNGFTYAN